MYQRQYLWLFRMVLSIYFFCGSTTISEAQRQHYIDSLQSSLKVTKSDTSRANNLLALADAYVTIDVGKEYYYANSAFNISVRKDWIKGKIKAEYLIGDCYYNVKRYHDAINYYKLCIEDEQKINRVDFTENCLQQLAKSYRGLNDQRNMIKLQKSAMEVAEKIGEPGNISHQMRTYSLFLSEAGFYHKAIDWARKDIVYTTINYKNNDQKNRIADLLNIIAGAFIKINGADSALFYLKIAKNLTIQTASDSQRSYILSTFCDVYQSIKMYDSAIYYGEQTIKMGEQFKNLDLQQYYCKFLSQIFEDDHKPLQALYYHKKYDSLMNIINNSQKMVDQAIQLSNINIAQETARDIQEKKTFDLIKHNQDLKLIAALALVLALIVFSIIIYSNLRLKHLTNKIISEQAKNLTEQNEIIDHALKEKEILLKETHHRVKNNLQLIVSLLELQSSKLEDEQAKKALYLAQQRVLSIANVHSKLYGSYEVGSIEFSSFTTDLFSRLNVAFGNSERPVKFENLIPNISLSLNTVVLLGIILNELITNSFKYAFQNNEVRIIKIELSKSNEAYCLKYFDNGCGLPEISFADDSKTLGLYLVRRLSKQLKGNVNYKFDGGSNFYINFPEVGN